MSPNGWKSLRKSGAGVTKPQRLRWQGKATSRNSSSEYPNEIDAGWSAWLAWRDGEAVGFLALKPKDQQIHQLFVLPESQGEGIGTMLLTHAKAELREGIWLSVFAENASARRFYERHGFAEGVHDKHPRTGQETIVYRWTPFID